MKKVDHPNIIKYYETYDCKNYLYIVMELCGGGPLTSFVINKAKNFDIEEQRKWVNKKISFKKVKS